MLSSPNDPRRRNKATKPRIDRGPLAVCRVTA